MHGITVRDLGRELACLARVHEQAHVLQRVFWLTPGHHSESGSWYAGSSPAGLFRSMNGGVHWEHRGSQMSRAGGEQQHARLARILHDVMDDVTEEMWAGELPAAARCRRAQREQALTRPDPQGIRHEGKHRRGLAPLSTAWRAEVRPRRRSAATLARILGRHGLANEQKRGQDVQWLESATDVAEDAFQVAQHARRELVHEKRAAGLEDIAGLLE